MMARQATAASIRSEFHTELDQSTALFGATPQVQSQRAQTHTKKWLSIASMEITVCPCYLQRFAAGTHETRDTCLQNILATYCWCTIAIGME